MDPRYGTNRPDQPFVFSAGSTTRPSSTSHDSRPEAGRPIRYPASPSAKLASASASVTSLPIIALPRPQSPQTPSSLYRPKSGLSRLRQNSRDDISVTSTFITAIGDEPGSPRDDEDEDEDEAGEVHHNPAYSRSTQGSNGSSERIGEDYVFEYGRRYHSQSIAYPGTSYILPNDEAEQEREDMKHKLAGLLMRDGAMFYAPVRDRLEKGGMVYDLGTGTGAWTMNVAEEFPKSKIWACDLSPIQPAFVWPNAYFFVDDFDKEWDDFEPNTFDLIHMRHALFCTHNLKALLAKVLKHLKPGGYFEIQEFHYWPRSDDATLGPDVKWCFRDFIHYVEQGALAIGKDFTAVTRIGDELRAAGFEDVTEVRTKCPLGAWPRDKRQRERGLYMNMIVTEGLGALAKRPLSKGLKWKDVQIELFLRDVRTSLQGQMDGVHAYWPFHVVYGRKPGVEGVLDGG